MQFSAHVTCQNNKATNYSRKCALNQCILLIEFKMTFHISILPPMSFQVPPLKLFTKKFGLQMGNPEQKTICLPANPLLLVIAG